MFLGGQADVITGSIPVLVAKKRFGKLKKIPYLC
jgi:hypothetical protein